MIDERMEEQASLYVLGGLAGEELREFETALRQDPELQRLVNALRAASDAVAGTAPLVTAPAALKQKILDEIDRREKIVPFESPLMPRLLAINWFPWALAAGFIVLCSIFAVQKNESERKSQAEVSGLRHTIAVLEATTNDLHKAVQELVEKNELISVRVAVLESLVPESKAIAVTLWDPEKQNGVLVAQKMPAVPADKDYQLWLIGTGDPVDAGVVKTDAEGNMRAEFKTKLPIKTVKKFAITIEERGGVPAPKGKMVLLGS